MDPKIAEATTARLALLCPASRCRTENILQRLAKADLPVDRICADLDGGIAMYVFGSMTDARGAHVRYVRIGITDEIGVSVLCVDRVADTVKAEDVYTENTVIERTTSFLRSCL